MVVSIHLKHIRQLGSFLQGFKVNTKKICELPPTIYKYHSLKPWGEHKIYVHIVVKPQKPQFVYPQVTPCAMATIKVLKRPAVLCRVGEAFWSQGHPWKMNGWNLTIRAPWKRKIIFQTIIYFQVNELLIFRGVLDTNFL